MCLLLHFTREIRINLPYFLWKILNKMVSKVQAHLENKESSTFYHGLIKLLVLDELQNTH